jgi:hypothetical protein
MDSTTQTAHWASEIINETASTGDACIRQTARAALETFNETASTSDAWIRQRKLLIAPQKLSTKLLPRVTHAFDSANSPCGLRNLQRN